MYITVHRHPKQILFSVYIGTILNATVNLFKRLAYETEIIFPDNANKKFEEGFFGKHDISTKLETYVVYIRVLQRKGASRMCVCVCVYFIDIYK